MNTKQDSTENNKKPAPSTSNAFPLGERPRYPRKRRARRKKSMRSRDENEFYVISLKLAGRTSNLLELASRATGWSRDEVIYKLLTGGLQSLEAFNLNESPSAKAHSSLRQKVAADLKMLIQRHDRLVFAEKFVRFSIKEIRMALLTRPKS